MRDITNTLRQDEVYKSFSTKEKVVEVWDFKGK